MSASTSRVLVAALASVALLSGCETSTKLGDLLHSSPSDAQATGSVADPAVVSDPTATGEPATTGTITTEGLPPVNTAGLLGSDPKDDLNLGKKHYRAGNYGIAERYFRRAVETHPMRKPGSVWPHAMTD